jgi:hypothetical protein
MLHHAHHTLAFIAGAWLVAAGAIVVAAYRAINRRDL